MKSLFYLFQAATQAQDKARREHAEALAIKKEQQHRMQQYNQQMQTLMDKERVILSVSAF